MKKVANLKDVIKSLQDTIQDYVDLLSEAELATDINYDKFIHEFNKVSAVFNMAKSLEALDIEKASLEYKSVHTLCRWIDTDARKDAIKDLAKMIENNFQVNKVTV